MAFSFMLFPWEDNSAVPVGLVKITHYETGSALHLYGVGSGLCGTICGMLRKLGNNSFTQLLHSLKPKNMYVYSFGLPGGPACLLFSIYTLPLRHLHHSEGFKYHSYADNLF